MIDAGLDEGRAQPASWIVEAVMGRHPFPPDWQGDDRDFAEGSCRDHVRVEVRKKLRDYKAGDENEASQAPWLPGFEHVQRAYLVTRHGEATVVPLDQLTDAEIESKEAALDTMGHGCFAHRDELRRYRLERAAARMAAAE